MVYNNKKCLEKDCNETSVKKISLVVENDDKSKVTLNIRLCIKHYSQIMNLLSGYNVKVDIEK